MTSGDQEAVERIAGQILGLPAQVAALQRDVDRLNRAHGFIPEAQVAGFRDRTSRLATEARQPFTDALKAAVDRGRVYDAGYDWFQAIEAARRCGVRAAETFAQDAAKQLDAALPEGGEDNITKALQAGMAVACVLGSTPSLEAYLTGSIARQRDGDLGAGIAYLQDHPRTQGFFIDRCAMLYCLARWGVKVCDFGVIYLPIFLEGFLEDEHPQRPFMWSYKRGHFGAATGVPHESGKRGARDKGHLHDVPDLQHAYREEIMLREAGRTDLLERFGRQVARHAFNGTRTWRMDQLAARHEDVPGFSNYLDGENRIDYRGPVGLDGQPTGYGDSFLFTPTGGEGHPMYGSNVGYAGNQCAPLIALGRVSNEMREVAVVWDGYLELAPPRHSIAAFRNNGHLHRLTRAANMVYACS